MLPLLGHHTAPSPHRPFTRPLRHHATTPPRHRATAPPRHRGRHHATTPSCRRAATSLSYHLTSLSCHNSALHQIIPTQLILPPHCQLGQLVALESSMLLYSNQLSSSIPTELGHIPLESNFELQANVIVSTLPSELGKMSKLASGSWQENKITGSLPSQLGMMQHLRELFVENSLWNDEKYDGRLPTELGTMSSLSFITGPGNRFTG